MPTPTVTRELLAALLGARAAYPVLFIGHDGHLSVWDSDLPAPGRVILRHSELIDLYDDAVAAYLGNDVIYDEFDDVAAVQRIVDLALGAA